MAILTHSNHVDHCNDIWWQVKTTELLSMQFSPPQTQILQEAPYDWRIFGDVCPAMWHKSQTNFTPTQSNRNLLSQTVERGQIFWTISLVLRWIQHYSTAVVWPVESSDKMNDDNSSGLLKFRNCTESRRRPCVMTVVYKHTGLGLTNLFWETEL